MKLATCRLNDKERVAIVHNGDTSLFDLAAASSRAGNANPAFSSMIALIDGDDAALDQARSLFDRYGRDADLSAAVSGAEILAPLPEPRQMRDGMSFPLHIRQSPRGQLKLKARTEGNKAELARLEAEPLPELPEIYRKQPIYYITNRFSVKGTNTTVKWPRYSKVMDYELEFGVVTKGKGANISAARRGIIFLAIRSSTTFRRAMPSASKWKAGSALQRAKASMAAMYSDRGSSHPTKSAIRTS